MTYRKGNYVLQQYEWNNHYMIIYDNGIDNPKMVLHASCTKRLTKKEAEDAIDFFLHWKNERESE